jgi:hypothetical protein
MASVSLTALAEDSLVLDAHPADSVLSKSTTLVIDPPDISESDFTVIWLGTPIPGVDAYIVDNSLQWVRTQEVLVLPRARVHLTIKNTAAGGIHSSVRGIVRHHGAVQSFEQSAAASHAEIPVALLSHPASSIEVVVKRADGVEEKGTLQVQFQSNRPVEKRLHIDASCSQYQVSALKAELSPQSWALVGCRLVYTKRESRTVPSLEVFLFWDGAGSKILIDGTASESVVPAVWALRLRSDPGRVRFSSTEGSPQNIELKYQVRSELHSGSFGVGFGPYGYRYTTQTGLDNINQAAGVLTFYGSVFFNHYMRAVMFSVLPVHRKIFNDTGLYLLVEQARILDNRMSINLLFGGHGILFPYDGANYFRFSFPQGIETVFRDFPYRRHNLTFGLFAYPFAGERSYYNAWLRWAMGPYFAELNYIKWDEIVRSGTLVGAELWGVSFGMPLFEFL